jgi:hypothetical protein
VAIFGELPSQQLAFCSKLKSDAMEMVCFEAAFRRRRLIKQVLEDAPLDADDAFVFPDPDTEHDHERISSRSSRRNKVNRRASENGRRFRPGGGALSERPSSSQMPRKRQRLDVRTEVESHRLPVERRIATMDGRMMVRADKNEVL